jgi:hypothetical protein
MEQIGPLEPISGRCNARRNDGSGLLCRNRAGKGTDHVGFGQCYKHGGATVSGRKNGARLAAEATVGELVVEALGELDGVPGHEQLGMAIMHAGAMALVYRRLLDELPVESEWSFQRVESHGQFSTPQRWVTVSKTGLAGPDQHGQLQLHPYEAAFARWTKLHASLLKTAHDIGMEERRQAFQETQVRTITDALIALVESLGHDLDDPKVVPIVDATLRSIAGAAA